MIRALTAGRQGRDAAGASGEDSERTCVVTRAKLSPAELIRFVADPAGHVVADIVGKLPGRGVWVTGEKRLVEKAIATNAFARSLRRKVAVAPSLADDIDALLVRRVVELMSLCNKAGLVTSGSAKVNSWIEAGADGFLVQARDASPGSLERVSRKYQAVCAALGIPANEISLLTVDQLSLAIGRSNVVHAAVSSGKIATNFNSAVQRLHRYRSAGAEAPDGLGRDAAAAESRRQPEI